MGGVDNLNKAGLAAVLSFIFNGLGQLYNGQIYKGLLLIFLSSLAITIFILGGVFLAAAILGMEFLAFQVHLGVTFCIVGFLSSCVIGIHSILDAYKEARGK